MTSLPYRVQLAPRPLDSYRNVVSVQLFDGDECNRILAGLDPEGWRPAEVTDQAGYGARTDTAIRSAALQNLTHDHTWAVQRLIDALAEVNDDLFRFDLWGVPRSDEPSVLRYRADERGHFLPHIDAGRGMSTRKLTYSVQLSHPEAYTGGDLVVTDGGHAASKTQGTLVAFPSTLHHVVSPVISGERFVLVGWIHGPTVH